MRYSQLGGWDPFGGLNPLDVLKPGDVLTTSIGLIGATIDIDDLTINVPARSWTDVTLGKGVKEISFHNFIQNWDYYFNWGLQRLTVTGNDEGNRVRFSGVAAQFHGGAGEDYVTYKASKAIVHSEGATGALDGGAGNDVLVLDLREGTNQITVSGGHVTGAWLPFLDFKQDPIVLDVSFTNFERLDIIGGQAGDSLSGGRGNDRIDGGAGNDLIAGGAGRDVLTGGAGADTFKFAAGDSGIGSEFRDVISDFQTGLDHIDLTAIPGVAYTLTDTATGTLIRIDADHNGSFEMQINVVGHLAQSDLLLAPV